MENQSYKTSSQSVQEQSFLNVPVYKNVMSEQIREGM